MIKKLYGNRVAIKPIVDDEEKTKSGIILANKKGKKKLIGMVHYVGTGMILPDGTKMPVEVPIGATVLYKQYAGVSVSEDDGEEYLILDAGDIIAEV